MGCSSTVSQKRPFFGYQQPIYFQSYPMPPRFQVIEPKSIHQNYFYPPEPLLTERVAPTVYPTYTGKTIPSIINKLEKLN